MSVWFQIMDYVTQQGLRGSTPDRQCFSNYESMKEFAEKMMEFEVYVPEDPKNTDFTDLDSVARAELLKVNGAHTSITSFLCCGSHLYL